MIQMTMFKFKIYMRHAPFEYFYRRSERVAIGFHLGLQGSLGQMTEWDMGSSVSHQLMRYLKGVTVWVLMQVIAYSRKCVAKSDG